MGGCSADYCVNSSQKGFQMCRIPRNEKRRTTWIANINREDWIPGPAASLCHVHFTEDMWEKTRDGKRRLKSDAVPTIFGKHIPVNTIKQEVQEPTQTELKTEALYQSLKPEPAFIVKEEDIMSENEVTNEMPEIAEPNAEASDELPLQQTSFCKDNENHKIQERLLRLEKVLEATEKSRLRFKKELYAAKRRIKTLENKIISLQRNAGSEKLNESVSEILNNDQIKVLTKTYKKVPRWCNKANKQITNTYKLRLACGTTGYKEILHQNLPYPCIRTMTKKNRQT
ncbi:uncharacterized protein LOC100879234 [Megachile rotundata]|uniref:uncharacterized protein LOC100879234 n=1 Tax=Megachile rotundata TaxID=143995 RepID=UPI003FD2F8EE